MSTEHEIIDNIKKKYPDIPKDMHWRERQPQRGEPKARAGIQKEHRLFLRTDKKNRDDLGFNFLVMVTAIDSIGLMDCAYFLGTFTCSDQNKKVSVPSELPTVNQHDSAVFENNPNMLINILYFINCKNKR
ncbi:MAG: hypothetical protein ACE5KE_02635 [Methanosarcinales archaeon]